MAPGKPTQGNSTKTATKAPKAAPILLVKYSPPRVSPSLPEKRRINPPLINGNVMPSMMVWGRIMAAAMNQRTRSIAQGLDNEGISAS